MSYFTVELFENENVKKALKEGRLLIRSGMILSFKNLEHLIEPETLLEIDMAQNYVRYFDEVFLTMTKL